MDFLILGGNGYLGSKIVRSLVYENHTVVCTKREKSDISRLNDINDKIIWIAASVDAIDAVMQYIPFDYVLNLACNYGRSSALYDGLIEANLEFPLEVLNKAVEKGTKNFLTIGTGLPAEFDMYSFSKKTFGNFGKFYVEKHGIHFWNLKLEMFYGSDEPEDRFIPSIIKKMLNGETVDITLGTQKRDIISVDDVIKAILLVIHSGIKGYCDIPVGTGTSPSVSEIVDYIWEETGRKSQINKGTIPMRENEPDCVADTTFLKSLGRWEPIDWKTGVKKMIYEMKKAEVVVK